MRLRRSAPIIFKIKNFIVKRPMRKVAHRKPLNKETIPWVLNKPITPRNLTSVNPENVTSVHRTSLQRRDRKMALSMPRPVRDGAG